MSFFNDNSKQEQLRKLLSGFTDGFTKPQKAAIIRYLLSTAKCTGTTSDKEMEYIESTANMLDFNLNDSALTNSLQQGIAVMIDSLKELTTAQKMWFVIATRELLQINGKVEDVKFTYTSKIFEYIGITDEILSKIQNLKL